MAERVIGVDVGGTNLRAAAVDLAGDIACRHEVRTPAKAGPEAVVDALLALADEAAAEAGLAADAPLGIAIPGPLDPATGIVAFTPNLKDWRDFPLGAALRQRTRRPFRLANDGNCAAVGEARFGAGRGVDDLIYLALGTGVGGGVIAGGRLIEGAAGFGGEVGHVVVALDGPRCTCGSVGCLEAFVGGWAIARDATLVATTDDGQTLARLAGGRPLSARIVAEAARAGDPAAAAILRRAGRALGAAMGAFANIFNPRLFVIGGGVGALGEALLEPARTAMVDHSFPRNRDAARIEDSRLGDDTALLGAAA
ncbi:MAG TPA: ROK family protein, partial [Thermomicrobiales bacterium]|nr:ROK family protein [Thermomicrobiales bacterium]